MFFGLLYLNMKNFKHPTLFCVWARMWFSAGNKQQNCQMMHLLPKFIFFILFRGKQFYQIIFWPVLTQEEEFQTEKLIWSEKTKWIQIWTRLKSSWQNNTFTSTSLIKNIESFIPTSSTFLHLRKEGMRVLTGYKQLLFCVMHPDCSFLEIMHQRVFLVHIYVPFFSQYEYQVNDLS